MEITQARINFICEFLSYCRPHDSNTEKQFINHYLMSLPGTNMDAFGNVHLDARTAPEHRTLFVAHTDTVHTRQGFQRVAFDAARQVFHTTGECLGADDGAGVLVLLHLIRNNVPGYYIFTRCEERGGQGAKYLVDYHADLLADFDRAIAFDRRGTSSIITHQGFGRCCSDIFAETLSELMSSDYLMYAPDDTGVYTDTAEFVDIIPECTNISVGYLNEHRPHETLDAIHLFDLLDQVLQIPWDALPVAREPFEDDYLDQYQQNASEGLTWPDEWIDAGNGEMVPYWRANGHWGRA
jgi:hypothetical protein